MKRKPNGDIVFSKDPADPRYWPVDMTFDEQLARLRQLDPEKADALAVLVEHLLREAWPSQGGAR